MKYNRLSLLLLLLATVLCSCNKERFNTSQIHGAQIEGELLFPVSSASYSIGDLLRSSSVDSIISFEEGGNLYFEYSYKQDDVLKGSDFMHYDGFVFDEHYTIENPYPFVIPQPIDTVIQFDYSVNLESEYFTLESGKFRSGIISFIVETNVGRINSMHLRSNEIKRADGTPLEIVTSDVSSPIVIDLAGLQYVAEEADILSFSHELRVTIENTAVPEFDFGIKLIATDIEVQELSGRVGSFDFRNRMDTTFLLFNENVSGALELKGSDVFLYERNGFGLSANILVDTAWLTSEGLGNYPIFNPIPTEIELPVSPANYYEALHNKVNVKINSNHIGMFLSSDIIFNPDGIDDVLFLSDTSTIDLEAYLRIPLKFCADDVRYIDTTEMNLSGIESQNTIEKLTLEMTLSSTIPLNLTGKFYLYDSLNNVIIDNLFEEGLSIVASYDGQPTVTTNSIDITNERLQNAMLADKIIMIYEVDTDAHDVVINANQKLDVFIKAKVMYNDVVEF